MQIRKESALARAAQAAAWPGAAARACRRWWESRPGCVAAQRAKYLRPAMQTPDRGLLPTALVALLVVGMRRALAALAARNRRVEKATQGEVTSLVAGGCLDNRAIPGALLSRDRDRCGSSAWTRAVGGPPRREEPQRSSRGDGRRGARQPHAASSTAPG
ncbi:MAG TPA: hypothetical protein VL242_26005 [Sorangium sp.]|nr:hypothetical protein [Sorangium sp.]